MKMRWSPSPSTANRVLPDRELSRGAPQVVVLLDGQKKSPIRGGIMSLTNYVTIGHSGLRVSPLCLGAMTFGEEWGWGTPVAESEAILSRFLEQGGNFLDTANGYTLGHSERIIGDYLLRDRGRRDRIVIATKFF